MRKLYKLKRRISVVLVGALVLGMSGIASGCGKTTGSTETTKEAQGDGPIELVYWNQWTQEAEMEFLEK